MRLRVVSRIGSSLAAFTSSWTMAVPTPCPLHPAGKPWAMTLVAYQPHGRTCRPGQMWADNVRTTHRHAACSRLSRWLMEDVYNHAQHLQLLG